MKDLLSRITASALLLTGTAGAAQPEGIYVGANLGVPSWNSGLHGVNGNNRGVSGKAFGGYELSPHFAVEAGGTWLGYTRDEDEKGKGAGAFIDAVGRFEFAPRWSALGRAGVAYARFSARGMHDSAAGLKAGAGLQYDVSDRVALRGEYEYYHFASAFDSKVNVGQLAVGIKVSF